jgi:ABC-type amino acid transport substrate-binding protein
VKRYRLTFIAKILLAALAFLVIWIHESSRGLFPVSGSGMLLSDASLEAAGKPLSLVLGVTDPSEAAGLVTANGGSETADGSILGNMNVSMKVRVFPDRLELERGFLHGSVNLMATTPARFGAVYATMDSISPVAFMLSAPSAIRSAIITGKNFSSTSDLAGMKIACARGGSAFFFAYYLSTLSGSGREISWSFTNDDEESLLLYRKGKVDAAAVSSTSAALHGDLPVAATSDIAPSFFSTVIVARESQIVAHRKIFASLVDAQFLSRKNILSLKDADAIKSMMNAGINPVQKINPAALIASDEDNRIFFRLSQARIWDYFNQFELGSDAARNPIVQNKILALETAHTLLIADCRSNSGKTGAQSDPPLPKKQIILAQINIQFKKDNNELSIESKSSVKNLLRKSIVFPKSVFGVSGGTYSNPAEALLAAQRAQAIRNFLYQEYTVPYTRQTNFQSNNSTILLIIPAATK